MQVKSELLLNLHITIDYFNAMCMQLMLHLQMLTPVFDICFRQIVCPILFAMGDGVAMGQISCLGCANAGAHEPKLHAYAVKLLQAAESVSQICLSTRTVSRSHDKPDETKLIVNEKC